MKTREQITAALAGKQERTKLKAERQSNGLLARLSHGRNLRRHTAWPGTEVAIDLAILTQKQRSEATAAAIIELRARGIDDGKPAPDHIEAATVEHIVQILARAIRDPETGAPVFASGAELAEAATEDEVAMLFGLYSDFRGEVDPEGTDLSEAEWTAFVVAVKKKEQTRWNAIAYSWPRTWLLSSVDRLAISLSSNSWSTDSVGEPPTPSEDQVEDQVEDQDDGGS